MSWAKGKKPGEKGYSQETWLPDQGHWGFGEEFGGTMDGFEISLVWKHLTGGGGDGCSTHDMLNITKREILHSWLVWHVKYNCYVK